MHRKRLHLFVAALAVALATTGCLAPRSPSKYGVNNSDQPARMDLTRDAGFKWARYFVSWDNLETARGWLDPGNLQYWKNTFDAASKRGFSIEVTFTREIPIWAYDPNQGRFCTKDAYKTYRQPGDSAYFYEFTKLVAAQFKPWVAAYEVYNEPDIDCRFPGNASNFQRLMLVPGVRGIREAQPDAIVLGPAVINGDINDYYTYKDASGRWLTTWVDGIAVHSYGTLSKIQADMDDFNQWVQCTKSPTRCQGDFWLTEYGFGEDDASAGSDAVAVIKKCNNQVWCRRAFYFSTDYDMPDGGPQYALLNPTTGATRAKYNTIKNYLTTH